MSIWDDAEKNSIAQDVTKEQTGDTWEQAEQDSAVDEKPETPSPEQILTKAIRGSRKKANLPETLTAEREELKTLHSDLLKARNQLWGIEEEKTTESIRQSIRRAREMAMELPEGSEERIEMEGRHQSLIDADRMQEQEEVFGTDPEVVMALSRPFAQLGTQAFVRPARGTAQTLAYTAKFGTSILRDIGATEAPDRLLNKLTSKLDKGTVIENELSEDYQKRLHESLQNGDWGSAVRQVGTEGGLEMTSGLLQIMMFGSLLKGTAPNASSFKLLSKSQLAGMGLQSGAALAIPGLAESGAKGILSNALIRGLYSYITTPGTAQQKTSSGFTTTMFMSTPLAARLVPFISGVADMGLNTMLSILSDAYPQALAAAKAESAASGKAESFIPLFLAHAMPIAVSDLIASSGTKYYKNTPSALAQLKDNMTPRNFEAVKELTEGQKVDVAPKVEPGSLEPAKEQAVKDILSEIGKPEKTLEDRAEGAISSEDVPLPETGAARGLAIERATENQRIAAEANQYSKDIVSQRLALPADPTVKDVPKVPKGEAIWITDDGVITAKASAPENSAVKNSVYGTAIDTTAISPASDYRYYTKDPRAISPLSGQPAAPRAAVRGFIDMQKPLDLSPVSEMTRDQFAKFLKAKNVKISKADIPKTAEAKPPTWYFTEDSKAGSKMRPLLERAGYDGAVLAKDGEAVSVAIGFGSNQFKTIEGSDVSYGPVPATKYKNVVIPDISIESRPHAEGIEVNKLRVSRAIDISELPSRDTRALRSGMEKGMSYLTYVRNATPENMNSIVSSMTKSEANGGLKGFGESSAVIVKAIMRHSSPEAALREINDWRLSKGKHPLVAPQPAEIIETAPTYRMTNEEQLILRDQMPWKKLGSTRTEEGWDNTPLGEATFNAVKNWQQMPLPTEPAAQHRAIKRLQQVALKYYKYHSTPRGILQKTWRNITDRMTQLMSRRHAFDELAENNADLSISEEWHRISTENSRGHYYIGTRYNNIIDSAKKAGLSRHDLPFLVDRNGKRREDNLAVMLYTDPRNIQDRSDLSDKQRSALQARRNEYEAAKEGLEDYTDRKAADKLLKERSGASKEEQVKIDRKLDKMAIPFDDKRNAWNKLFTSIRGEFSGPSAVNARVLQLRRWIDSWNKLGGRIVKLERIRKRNAKQEENYQNAVKELSAATPKTRGEDGQPQDVSRKDMLTSSKIWRDKSDEGLRAYLSEQKWGTRKYYWLSEPDSESLMPRILQSASTSEKPTDPGAEPVPVGFPGEISPRLREGKPLKGDLLPNLYRHMYRLEMRSRLLDDTKSLWSKITGDERIHSSTKGTLTKTLENVMGAGQDFGPVTGLARGIVSYFWRRFSMTLSSIGFYTLRNRLQPALLATQYPVPEIARAKTGVITDMRNPESNLRKAYNEIFLSDVSQRQALYREAMLGGRSAEETSAYRGNIGRATAAVDRWSNFAMGWSDGENRTDVFNIGYKIAENAVDEFIDGRITQAQLEDRVIISNLPVASQTLHMNRFAQASGGPREAYEPFIRELAKDKNDAINFRYRTTDRSGIEQWAAGRLGAGLFTWPRGAAEIFFHHGAKRVSEGLRSESWADVKAGLRTMGMYTLTMYGLGMTSNMLLGRKGGQKQKPTYHPWMSMVWTPVAPGAQILIDSVGIMDTLRSPEALDDGQIAEVGKYILDQATYMIPGLADLANFYETINDEYGVRNTEMLIGWIDGEIESRGFTERTWLEKVQHSLLGTAEIHESVQKTIYDSLPWIAKGVMEEPWE